MLVGVDGSSGSAGAADWALAEAAARKWGVLFVTAVQPAQVADPQVDGAYFHRAAREAELTFGPLIARAQAHGIAAASQVVMGRASDVLARLSAQAGLAVVGRRERTGLISRLGSVSAALAAHSACPTAVIPETWSHAAEDSDPASGRGKFSGQVIASVEHGPEAAHLLAVAAKMAEQHGVPLCAITVDSHKPVPGRDSWLADLLHSIREQHPGLEAGTCVLSGTPAHEIAEAARGARLLVIGTRGLSGIPGLIRGSVSQALLEATSAPVLVVPSRHHGPKHA